KCRPRIRRTGPSRARGRVQYAFHNEGWPVFDLIVDVGKVGADNAQAKQLNSAEEQDDDRERGESTRRQFWEEEPRKHLQHDPQQRQTDRKESKPCDQIQRSIREGEDGFASPPKIPKE